MILFLLIGSFFTFILFMIDKSQALISARRIPEWVLLLFSFFFGVLGVILGMIVFSHKTSKKAFIIKISIIFIFQFLFFYLLWLSSYILKDI